jgi:uncharacterized protein YjbJ (UPF0337 family)
MNANRVGGTAKNLQGSRRADDRMKPPEGRVQELYGQAIDGAGEAVDAVRKIPGSIEDSMREYILALLWQIYSRCCSLQIHFRQ